ncbi:MAG: hypothetical protein KGL26_01830 [Pseudomonadota bacterium]|nr:hypothetical protein [Pseudomonadota bacterium]
MKFRDLLIVALCVLSTTAAAIAAVNPELYQALHWRLIGPFRGGRVLTVSGIPGDARDFYFGAVDGGVWKTDDAGRTWKPIFDAQKAGSIGALALAPSDPKIIYVGTGEADMRSDIAHGDGLYKSTDGGTHWTHIGLEDSRQIGRILVNPTNPDIAFVAALGHAYGPNAERGVFRSTDGGKNWVKVLFKDDDTGAIDLAFKPGDPNTIYAALWQARRPPWNVYPPSNGPGSGLYVSHDGGDHWAPITGGGFPAHPGRIGIALSPSTPDRIYALADAPAGEGGLYRSDDGGARWSHVTDDKRLWQRGWYFSGITIDPKNADRVYVMNTIVLRSDDGGAHFIALKGDPTGDDFHAMWIDPTDPDRRILGVDQGTLITNNGGKTWSSWYNQPTAQIYHVSTDNRFPYWVYGAQQDSGAVALPSRTNSYDGITMEQFHEVTAGGESGMIVPDPDDPDIVFGGTVDKLDLKTGQTRDVDPTLAYPAAHYRGAWTLPLKFSHIGKRTLYFANQQLFATTDRGLHWAAISPDLTRPDPGAPANLDPATAADDVHVGKRRGVIYTISPSPKNPALIWVGTDDGLVWKTIDGGKHWANVTPPELTAWSKIGGIELSHFDPFVAYLAIDRHRLDDDAPYIYRTADGGKNWVRINNGIAQDAFVNVVREDPVRRGLLYAGTEKGMYVSFDNGAHWQPLQQNLPSTSVRDIDVHGDDLVIATHGRGFWIMDDVTALRQIPSVDANAATLFAPATAIRMRPAGFTGTPMPKDEPMAENPPDGAIIDYMLPASVRGAVTLRVLDSSNKLVREFSSAAPIVKPDAAKLDFAPEWMPIPAHLSAAPGMQRFVWNLRYAPLSKPEDESEDDGGVWAVPGRYTVVLSVAGKDYRQPLIVEPDPRLHLPPAAYAQEFALAMQVAERRAQLSAALSKATGLIKALEAREHDAKAPLRAQLSVSLDRVTDLSGVPLHSDPRNSMGAPPRSVTSLKALAKGFNALQKAVDGADAEPSPDARASYAMLARMTAATLADWKNWIEKDLPALNAALKSAGAAPVDIAK